MLCIRATLTAGSAHEKFHAGQHVASILFAATMSLEQAEDLLAPVLAARGWATMAIERYKEVREIEAINDPLLREAFRDAEASGVGYVIFPELPSSKRSSTNPLGGPV
jgi:hypothetical protein